MTPQLLLHEPNVTIKEIKSFLKCEGICKNTFYMNNKYRITQKLLAYMFQMIQFQDIAADVKKIEKEELLTEIKNPTKMPYA